MLHPHLASRQDARGVVQNGRFYRQEGGAEELLAKERGGTVSGQDTCFGGKGNVRV